MEKLLFELKSRHDDVIVDLKDRVLEKNYTRIIKSDELDVKKRFRTSSRDDLALHEINKIYFHSLTEKRRNYPGNRKEKSHKIRKKITPYESPFVLKAREDAIRRVGENYPRERSKAGWNSDLGNIPLFDPLLKKQEIFKISPRVPNRYETSIEAKGAPLHSSDLIMSKNIQSNKSRVRSTFIFISALSSIRVTP